MKYNPLDALVSLLSLILSIFGSVGFFLLLLVCYGFLISKFFTQAAAWGLQVPVLSFGDGMVAAFVLGMLCSDYFSPVETQSGYDFDPPVINLVMVAILGAASLYVIGLLTGHLPLPWAG